jgi:hypothetical protein
MGLEGLAERCPGRSRPKTHIDPPILKNMVLLTFSEHQIPVRTLEMIVSVIICHDGSTDPARLHAFHVCDVLPVCLPFFSSTWIFSFDSLGILTSRAKSWGKFEAISWIVWFQDAQRKWNHSRYSNETIEQPFECHFWGSKPRIASKPLDYRVNQMNIVLLRNHEWLTCSIFSTSHKLWPIRSTL